MERSPSCAGTAAEYNFPVRVAAILHPYRSNQLIEPFRDPRANVFRGNALEPNDLPDAALIFGGDGSVHRVLPALAHSATPMLVVPCGSANDFAHCLGIRDVATALRAWKKYLEGHRNVRVLDLCLVRPLAQRGPGEMEEVSTRTFADSEGRFARPDELLGPVIMRHNLRLAEENDGQKSQLYVAGIAGLGLDAETNRVADRMPGLVRRYGGYMLAALRALATYRAPQVRLICYDGDGRETVLEGPTLFAAIGSAPVYGSGIRMLPRAQMDDGELDLCWVPMLSITKILRHILKIYSGRHVEVPEVSYQRTVQVFVESVEPLALWGDGEPLCQTPAEITVVPGALRVIVP